MVTLLVGLPDYLSDQDFMIGSCALVLIGDAPPKVDVPLGQGEVDNRVTLCVRPAAGCFGVVDRELVGLDPRRWRYIGRPLCRCCERSCRRLLWSWLLAFQSTCWAGPRAGSVIYVDDADRSPVMSVLEMILSCW